MVRRSITSYLTGIMKHYILAKEALVGKRGVAKLLFLGDERLRTNIGQLYKSLEEIGNDFETCLDLGIETHLGSLGDQEKIASLKQRIEEDMDIIRDMERFAREVMENNFYFIDRPYEDLHEMAPKGAPDRARDRERKLLAKGFDRFYSELKQLEEYSSQFLNFISTYGERGAKRRLEKLVRVGGVAILFIISFSLIFISGGITGNSILINVENAGNFFLIGLILLIFSAYFLYLLISHKEK